MRRRLFLKRAGAASAATVLSAVSYPGKSTHAQARFRWRLAHSFAASAPVLGTNLPRMAERLKTLSKGALEIRVYGAGQLVPALGLFDAVKDGTIQMMYSASYYWAGRLPAAQFTCSLPFGMNAQQTNAWFVAGGGLDLWREFYGKQGLIPFVAGNTGMELGGWFLREIRGLEDFRTLKMRIAGLGGRVVAALGGTVVPLPGQEIVASLKRGAIDAAEWAGPLYDQELGLAEAAPFCYTPGWQQPSTANELTINLRAWGTLPAELRAMIEQAAAQLNLENLAEFDARNAEALRKIEAARGVTIRTFPADVMTALAQAADRANQQLAESDADARRVFESYKRFQDGAAEWTRIGELAYLTARQAMHRS